MTATASLFSDNESIGTEDAPQYLLNVARLEWNYHAVLKKRFGNITASDFLKYARRLVVLCDEIYQGSVLELRVPLDSFDRNFRETVEISTLTENSFRKVFKHSWSMRLTIRPMILSDEIRHSFAQIEWTRCRPRAIFFYAQQGEGYILWRPLENLLLRKLFYVSGVAPSLNFVVGLGLSVWMDEVEGKPLLS